MFNWIKKLLGWPAPSKPIPEVQEKKYVEPIQEMIDQAAPIINPPKVVRGRKKRTAKPPRR